VAASRSRRCGLTLVELVVALGVSSIVLVAATSVYYYAVSEWNTGAADTSAFIAASQGSERMCRDIARGRYATLATMPDGRKILRVGMFRSSVDIGDADYFPDPGDSGFDPGSADEYWFYLSDGTGSIVRAGDILWRAYKPSGSSAAGEQAWTMYEGTSRPRVSGVTQLDFTIYSDTNLVYTTMTVKGKESQAEQPRRVIRWAYMRNHD
jgi:prepilin-type N-terminal cleavage/methylation domain-containing protein